MNIPSLCLIHGWAANGAVFNNLRRRVPVDWQSTAPDLPGHGSMPPLLPHFSVDGAADQIASGLDRPVHLFGWSLGGLVSLYVAARYPEKVKSLTLCSTFARFAADDHYPEGIRNSVLDKMVDLFQDDYPKHMRQFLELQLLNMPHLEEVIASVLPDMLKQGAPKALADALAAVKVADARLFLPKIQVPVLLIYGNRDSVTPVRMGEYMTQHLPNSHLYVVDRAAHAPFLSHETEVAQQWFGFVSDVEHETRIQAER